MLGQKNSNDSIANIPPISNIYQEEASFEAAIVTRLSHLKLISYDIWEYTLGRKYFNAASLNFKDFQWDFLTKPWQNYKIMDEKDIHFSSCYYLHGRDLSFQIINRNQILYPL